MSEITKKNFIRQIIDADLQSGKHTKIVTRFPPEPNGYLHIGHAKSIWLNFGIAHDYEGQCNLRFDDTNPCKESEEYVRAIEEDVRWLGYDIQKMANASDYFETLYGYAIELIEKGLAYVDSLNAEQMREYRGTLTEKGKNSPDRARPIAENLNLFQRMRAGEFADGTYVLRAKIDMAAANINMRDPVIYRIRHVHHQRTGDKWCIYPMYDFTHGLSDAIEGITHSLCTLEFEAHRELYDWFIQNVSAPSTPRQIEFSRLNLNFTVMSKRLLNQLVDDGNVSGWDDPRMPTLSGLRRRGFTPASIRHFISLVGITKKDNVIEMGVLENCIREDLDAVAPRAFAVLDPIKVIITDYPQNESETITVKNHPKDDDMGSRDITLSREIYIERDDFMLDPPSKYFRLAPGQEVRLRYGFVIRCEDVIYDENGNITQLHCSHDKDTRNGKQPEGRKVKGIIHWVNANDCVDAEVHVYDRLFNTPFPSADKADFKQHLNPDSLHVLKNAKLEPSIIQADPQTRFQFERLGYFFADKNSRKDKPVYNRVVTLRDSWAALANK